MAIHDHRDLDPMLSTKKCIVAEIEDVPASAATDRAVARGISDPQISHWQFDYHRIQPSTPSR